jgi:hypothetical protein
MSGVVLDTAALSVIVYIIVAIIFEIIFGG